MILSGLPVPNSAKPLKIAIASGKGGTGKTLLATNLAAFLSKRHKTLLVDLDVEEPNDSIFFSDILKTVSDYHKMIPAWEESRCTLCGICVNSCKYHAVIQFGDIIEVFGELCHSCHACSELCPENALPMQPHKNGEIKTVISGNLTLVEGRLEVGEEQAVPLIHHIHELVNDQYNAFSLQIFDSPPGTSCPVVAAVKDADVVILVTEPTPFGAHDLKLAVKTIRVLGKPMGVVINRFGIGNKEVELFCTQEHLPVVATIPFSRQIAESYSRGELVYEQVKEVETALRLIMENLDKTVMKNG